MSKPLHVMQAPNKVFSGNPKNAKHARLVAMQIFERHCSCTLNELVYLKLLINKVLNLKHK